MINCVKRDDIDVKKWDACIQASPNSRLYAMSYYLDAVCSEGNWSGLIYGDYDAVMPLPINRRIPFFPRIMLPHFAQQLGVFSAAEITSELISQFISSIPKEFKSVYLQLNDANKISTFPDAEVRHRNNYILPLSKDHETIFNNFSRNLKKNIQKAEKLHLSLDQLDAAEFIPFYLAHDKSKYTQKSRILNVLADLLPTLLDRRQAIIYAARDETETIMAACVMTIFQGRLTYLMANSSPEGRSKRVMHWLLDQIIKTHCEDMSYFDFEGSDIPSIAEFFSFFGTEIVQYPLVKYDRFPFNLIS